MDTVWAIDDLAFSGGPLISPVEVQDYAKNLLRNCALGDGYCVGSGNSVPDWSKFENFMAMRDTTLKYGVYPISL